MPGQCTDGAFPETQFCGVNYGRCYVSKQAASLYGVTTPVHSQASGAPKHGFVAGLLWGAPAGGRSESFAILWQKDQNFRAQLQRMQ